MAKKTPHVVDGIYHYYDLHEQKVTQTYNIGDEWERWQEDLKTLRTVRVTVTNRQGFKMVYSVSRQKHPHSPVGFWVAKKKIEGRRRIKYIGTDRNMTTKKFADVAPVVCQAKLL